MKKNDFISASVAIIVALVFLFISTKNRVDGNSIIVFVDNLYYSSYSLDDNKEIIIPSYDNTGTLKLRIEGKMVRAVESDCKNKICINKGYISKSGDTIVCLPQRIVVQINSDKVNEFDGFTN